MQEEVVGIIGGTGLYEINDVEIKKVLKISTPYGEPSDELTIGELLGRKVIFLPRHGRDHRILPSEINFRANIMALKILGATTIISVSAVGSMREEIAPKEIVLPDQFFDRTKLRNSTFFGNGIAAHVSFADPVCVEILEYLYSTCKKLNIKVHKGGTYVCIEGPQFSTRAESRIYRQWGVDVIGMTNLQEAMLSREAEMCFATIALVTDYDCWHESEDDVSVEGVMEVLKYNTKIAKKIIRETILSFPETRYCSCHHSLQNAILTSPDVIPNARKLILKPLLGKYQKFNIPGE